MIQKRINKKINSPSFFIGLEGNDIISFGSGQPDLPPPKEVFKVLPKDGTFKYGHIQGMPKLREALAEKYPDATSENFVITNGASEALDLVFRALSTGKEKVLLPKPYYYSYPYIVKYAGLEPVYVSMIEGKIDLEDFKEKVKDCKAVLINSPSNPTGRIESIKTLKEIEKICNDLGIYIISDEVYKDLIYERENYLMQGEKVVTINSFSKTYCMCGLRVGYLWSKDQNLINKVIEMKTHTSMNTNLIGQEMAYAATNVSRNYIDEQVKIWKARRDVIYNGLKEIGLELWKPEGAFYVLPKMPNSNKAVNDLFYKHKIITYDGAWFGAPNRIRLSYALDIKKIEEGLERIKKYLADLKKI